MNTPLSSPEPERNDNVLHPVAPPDSVLPYRSRTLNYLNDQSAEFRLWLLGAVAMVVVTGVGLWLQRPVIGIPAAIIALVLLGRIFIPSAKLALDEWVPRPFQIITVTVLLTIFSLIALLNLGSIGQGADRFAVNWDAVGALAEAFGAIGQIAVAFLALYVAWRQYVISKDLTTQQNRITQQQTIDAYFQGISDLILDDEGLLEDWPPERAIAEGRTAAILTGLDNEGKAKVIRFLSSSKLLTPLKRDRRLGRPIFDGLGGYEEDIEYGVRVIDLTGMLAGSDLSNTDLRWTELSEANLAMANLSGCDLTRANLSRTILTGANLRQANLSRTRLFHGSLELTSPRDRINPPNYQTGAYTGAVIEGVDLSSVQNLTDEQRYYCCAWGGSKTRRTIPGGCEGIPNRLER
jgi:uncharacterized protein YjbI with pentapeptide repeats